MVKRHRRPTQNDAGGIIPMEAPMHISNVAHIDPDNWCRNTRRVMKSMMAKKFGSLKSVW